MHAAMVDIQHRRGCSREFVGVKGLLANKLCAIGDIQKRLSKRIWHSDEYLFRVEYSVKHHACLLVTRLRSLAPNVFSYLVSGKIRANESY